MHFVYVIRNPEGRVYVGCTGDVARRLLDHNAGISKWTRFRGGRVFASSPAGEGRRAARVGDVSA